MTRIVCLNGEFVPEDEARIPIMDRGLLFADAIYEGMGVLDGGIVDVRKHLARLRRSLAEVGIPEPHTEEELLGILMELVRRNDVDEGFLYLHVTRGVAERAACRRQPHAGPPSVLPVAPAAREAAERAA